MRLPCAWGMEDGITNPRGNQFGEFCCNATTHLQILCAHNGCSAEVGPTLSDRDKLRRTRLSTNGPKTQYSYLFLH
jgi:hypothetical protein